MTKEQMEELANLVAEKLWEKQMQLEEEAEQSTEKIGEMAKLETMLSILEQSEEYAKAYEVKQRLDKIKGELKRDGILREPEE